MVPTQAYQVNHVDQLGGDVFGVALMPMQADSHQREANWPASGAQQGQSTGQSPMQQRSAVVTQAATQQVIYCIWPKTLLDQFGLTKLITNPTQQRLRLSIEADDAPL